MRLILTRILKVWWWSLKLKHNVKLHARHARAPQLSRDRTLLSLNKVIQMVGEGDAKRPTYSSFCHCSSTPPRPSPSVGREYLLISSLLGHPVTHKVVEKFIIQKEHMHMGMHGTSFCCFLKKGMEVSGSRLLAIQRQTKFMILCESRGSLCLVNSNKPRRRGRRQRVHLDSSNQVVTGKHRTCS